MEGDTEGLENIKGSKELDTLRELIVGFLDDHKAFLEKVRFLIIQEICAS